MLLFSDYITTYLIVFFMNYTRSHSRTKSVSFFVKKFLPFTFRRLHTRDTLTYLISWYLKLSGSIFLLLENCTPVFSSVFIVPVGLCKRDLQNVLLLAGPVRIYAVINCWHEKRESAAWQQRKRGRHSRLFAWNLNPETIARPHTRIISDPHTEFLNRTSNMHIMRNSGWTISPVAATKLIDNWYLRWPSTEWHIECLRS